MKTPVRHIIFDIGNVLIEWDSEIPFRRLIPDDTARAEFMRDVCSPAWNLEQDRGRSWTDAEKLLIAQYPDKADMIKGYRKYWHDMVKGPVPGTVELLERFLEAGWDVTGLTNFASDTLAESMERFPFLKRFRHVTISAEIGLVKPDQAIYQHHVHAAGLDPAACFFIDDSLKNVEAARACGWQAWHFAGIDGLVSHLEQLGIDPDHAPKEEEKIAS